MNHSVGKFSEFGGIPAVGGTHKVAGDALEAVNAVAFAFRTFLKSIGGVLITAIQAPVSVVVNRAVADIVFIHKVDDILYGLGVMGSITVNFHIEDVAAACKLVVGTFYTGLMCGRTMIVHRHMIGICVIGLVGHPWDLAETFTVFSGELTREAFGGSGEDREVVGIALGELICA